MRSVLIAMWAALASCGGTSVAPTPPPCDAGIAPSVPSIRGKSLTRYITATGITDVADDLSFVDVSAIVHGTGGFTIHRGTAAADGTFAIPGVPDGTYTLHVGRTFVVTSSHDVALTTYVVGRMNPLEESGIDVRLDIDNLAPFTDFAFEYVGLNLIVPNVGLATELYPLRPAASANDTAYHGRASIFQRLDPARADASTLVQYARGPAAPGRGRLDSIVRKLDLPGFAVNTTTEPQIMGTMVENATKHSFVGAIGESLTSIALFNQPEVGLSVLSVVLGDERAFATVVLAAGNVLDRRSPIEIPFGGWLPGTDTWAGVSVRGLLRDTPGVGRPYFTMHRYAPIADIDGTTIEARVGPIQLPRINGKPALSSQTGIGTSPTLTWSAPQSVSDAGSLRYAVTITKGRLASAIAEEPAVVLWTTDTSLTIPPGVLANGLPHSFEIAAYLAPPGTFASDPIVVSQRDRSTVTIYELVP